MTTHGTGMPKKMPRMPKTMTGGRDMAKAKPGKGGKKK